MVRIVNHIGTHASCVGNHDLDFGEEQALKLTQMSKFPWLLSNVHLVDGSHIAGSLDYTIIEHAGHKIGVIALAESDWISTLSHFDAEDIEFEDPIECAEELSSKLSRFAIFRKRRWLRLHHSTDAHASAKRQAGRQRVQRCRSLPRWPRPHILPRTDRKQHHDQKWRRFQELQSD